MTENKETAAQKDKSIQSTLNDFFHAHVFGLLLIVLLLLLATCASIATTQAGLILSDVLLFAVTLIVAMISFKHRRSLFAGFVICAFLSCVIDILAIFITNRSTFIVMQSASGFGFAVLIVSSITLLIKSLNHRKRTTIDTVHGGICVYLLFAFLFFLFYDLLNIMDPTAFSYAFKRNGEYDLMYFSINTLTTLGHGDIVPINRLGMVLCNIEAMIGQIFPAVFIAKLVSFYTADQQSISIEAQVVEIEADSHSAG